MFTTKAALGAKALWSEEVQHTQETEEGLVYRRTHRNLLCIGWLKSLRMALMRELHGGWESGRPPLFQALF